MAVGAGGLSPAKDASGPARHLIAPRRLVGEVVVLGCGLLLGSVRLRVLLVVVVVVVVPASFPTAAAAAAALLPLASLARVAKPLELVAVLGGMGVPVVVDAEGAIMEFGTFQKVGDPTTRKQAV